MIAKNMALRGTLARFSCRTLPVIGLGLLIPQPNLQVARGAWPSSRYSLPSPAACAALELRKSPGSASWTRNVLLARSELVHDFNAHQLSSFCSHYISHSLTSQSYILATSVQPPSFVPSTLNRFLTVTTSTHSLSLVLFTVFSLEEAHRSSWLTLSTMLRMLVLHSLLGIRV